MQKLNTYLVGGAVRDTLLGLPIIEKDWVVVGATPAELIKQNFLKVGKDFPVFLHPKTHEEYALARTERKIGSGYYGFECDFNPSVTLEEDLLRRDLTINAMAFDQNNQLIDPFNGKQDLENKILRHVSPAFMEDPVRILRIARFTARFSHLGFTIAPETIQLMKSMVQKGEVNALVPERVWKEMEKALMEQTPTRFFEVLKEVGALKVLWSDLDKLWGIPQPEQWHPEVDTGIHVMKCLEQAQLEKADAYTRFAVLCHDLGKGRTPIKEWPSHRGHEEAGVPLIKEFCNHYKIANEYKDLSVLISRFHLHAHKAFELRP
ncbi:MAG: Multifunctional protein, partial [Francisellaceae bacterium]|nr:Multifunctional protein [Francisellaceae bacterium]